MNIQGQSKTTLSPKTSQQALGQKTLSNISYQRLSKTPMAGISSLRSILSRRVIRLGSGRCYGCAAQLDYDSDEYSDEEIVPAVVETERSCSGRGVQWVVIGEPGAKKHVYAERLSKLLEVPHISMGTLVRQELSPVSSLYKQIAAAVNQGKLVPEDIIYGLLSKRLEEGYWRGETGFILDGFPRTRSQAEILDQIADVDLVVNLKSTEEHLVKKHLRSGTVSNLLEYHSNNSGSNGLNLNLLKTSTSNSGFAWNDKLRVYAEQSKPLEEYYRKQQKLIDFQVAGPPGETWQGLLAALHLQHVDAVNSTKKLTV